MKLLKSLILGAAAICAASWGAQAADLPLKAKPVEYVKICSAYGAGFYYIPGTDICLKVGGYVWYDLNINQRGELIDLGNSPQISNDYGPLTTRVRAVFIMDARTATQYGSLRSYVAIGMHWTSCGTLSAAGLPNNSAVNGCQQLAASGGAGTIGEQVTYTERAFIQFAGFTFGYVGSFFDFNSSYSITTQHTHSFKWTPALAYTIQFGSGLSSTFSLEDATTRRSQIAGCNVAALAFGAAAQNTCNAVPGGLAYGAGTGGEVVQGGFTGYGGQQAPVIVWNLRVDQAWGSAQVSVGGHELKVNQFLAGNGVPDKWGWAVLGGVEFKVGALDSVMLQGVWGSGAAEFTGITSNPATTLGSIGRRTQGGSGPVFDIMDSFVTGTQAQELTTQWAINAQYRHFWNPMLRSAIFGGFNGQNMGPQAQLAGYPDLELWQAGINTIWSPVKDLDLGVEILYTNVRTVCTAPCVPGANAGALGNGVPRNNTSIDVVSGVFRARRNW